MQTTRIWRHFDIWLLAAVALLTIAGVTMIRSAIGGNEDLAQTVPRQAIYALIGLVILLLFTPLWAQEDKLYEEGYLLPSELVQDFMNRDGHTNTLNNISPDGIHFMIPVSEYFSSLKLMTQRTLRLGMLEICPDVSRSWRLSTYGNTGIKIYSLEQRQ